MASEYICKRHWTVTSKPRNCSKCYGNDDNRYMRQVFYHINMSDVSVNPEAATDNDPFWTPWGRNA